MTGPSSETVDELPEALVRIIEAMAEAQAQSDYAAAQNPKVPEKRGRPSLRYRRHLAKLSGKTAT